LKAEGLARKAHAALFVCAKVFGERKDLRLADMVMDDGMVADLLEDVADPHQRGSYEAAARRVKAAAETLFAVRPVSEEFGGAGLDMSQSSMMLMRKTCSSLPCKRKWCWSPL
jgi:hypothetical protein